MFTQPCLIRNNTKELRDKLQELGYKIASKPYFEDRERGILCRPNLAIGIPNDCCEFNLKKYLKENPQIVDCGTNEKLFLALAALRDDTDKYQLFVNKDGNFFKCFENEFSHFRFDDKAIGKIVNAMETGSSPCFGEPLVPYEDTVDWHKATVKELIEHFK